MEVSRDIPRTTSSGRMRRSLDDRAAARPWLRRVARCTCRLHGSPWCGAACSLALAAPPPRRRPRTPRRVHAAGHQPGRVREHASRARPEHVADRRRRRPDDPGLRDVDERQQGRDDRASRSSRRRPNYRIDILRLGYYGGDGARLIDGEPRADRTPSTQPACQTFSRHRPDRLRQLGGLALVDGARATAVSGVYIAHLHPQRHRRRQPHHVRRPRRREPLRRRRCRPPTRPGRPTTRTAATASTSARSPARPATRARTRPPTRSPTTARSTPPRTTAAARALFTGAEYPMIRFLEAQRLRRQLHQRRRRRTAAARCCCNHKLFISSGHDEYWSATQRTNMEAARDAGVNLAFFSGNEMLLEDALGAEHRRHQRRRTARSSPTRTRTSTRRSRTRSSGPAPGATRASRRRPTDVTPENALTGQSFLVNSGTSRDHGAVRVPPAAACGATPPRRRWRRARRCTLAPDDARLRVGRRRRQRLPAARASSGSRRRPSAGVEVFTDYGSTIETNGDRDAQPDDVPGAERRARVRRRHRAVGVGPRRREPGGNAARPQHAAGDGEPVRRHGRAAGDAARRASSARRAIDRHHARRRRRSPRRRRRVADGTQVTITRHRDRHRRRRRRRRRGLDRRRHHAGIPATGHDELVLHAGSRTATRRRRSRRAPSTTAATSRRPAPASTVDVTCPCSLWGTERDARRIADSGDPTPVEVGVKFTSDAFGTITGVRFYKAAGEHRHAHRQPVDRERPAARAGDVHQRDGVRLADRHVRHAGRRSSPDTTYVASYYAPNGHYSATADYFYRAPAPGPNGGAIADSPPLHARAQHRRGTTNGVFTYGADEHASRPTRSARPTTGSTSSSRRSPAPGAVTNVTATAGGRTSANVTWTAPVDRRRRRPRTRITPYIGATAQTPTTVTGSPPATTHDGDRPDDRARPTRSASQAINPNGSGPVSAPSNAVTPQHGRSRRRRRPASSAAAGVAVGARDAGRRPASDGDSPITGYTVTPYIGATAQTPVQVGRVGDERDGHRADQRHELHVPRHGDQRASARARVGAPRPRSTPQATIFDFATPATVDSGDAQRGRARRQVQAPTTTARSPASASTRPPPTPARTSAACGRPTGTRLAQATFTQRDRLRLADGDVRDARCTSPPARRTSPPTSRPAATTRRPAAGFDAASTTGRCTRSPTRTSANGVYAYGATSTFPTSTLQRDQLLGRRACTRVPAPGPGRPA